ncbi:unnamed protein product [Polarella glacialis]|uniref:Methyltransferase type 11 domain-containing protein n=1 Tax=Polarella glacialis TaxID=89957 RepID=A0A813EC74_POLGL|nr:unnamed protein product [Polarella glacialis]CAE8719553.1 unnamed protein product [Polarella glacialis]
MAKPSGDHTASARHRSRRPWARMMVAAVAVVVSATLRPRLLFCETGLPCKLPADKPWVSRILCRAAPSASGEEDLEPWATVEAAYDRISENFAESRRFTWPFVVNWLLGSGRSSQEARENSNREGRDADSRHRLLVAGCGDGRNVDAAIELEKFDPIWALDISQGMLQAAERRLGPERSSRARFLHGDVCEVPLQTASCDAVLCCAVLHHLPGNRSLMALREFARLLAPGGRLLVSCWDPRAPALTKRGRRAAGPEDHAYWVAWRCADGKDVDRWYHLPPLSDRLTLWSGLPGLELVRAELDGDNQVFEWARGDGSSPELLGETNSP